MSRVFKRRFENMFVSGAVVDLAVGHTAAAERAVEALRALHPGLRVGGLHRDRGLLWIEVGFETAVYPEDILESVMTIVTDARTLSAWSCSKDGRPGWLVRGPKGPTVLCPDCQKAAGLEVKRHEA
ncbi:hypothetical protein IFT59_07290 [Rhizobium sp. CFBP 8752]|uniref:hypothetical protein n=1 Tax=Rhizobium sp. CFBP 8752 TaxID=2775301 RepID=UPI00177AD9CF|nr:hypothetical protein [Rhizobium sp. CFBP 8752]MBD8663056.1 hypothetical protein [Rhizobium sp. CFBP 8752]